MSRLPVGAVSLAVALVVVVPTPAAAAEDAKLVVDGGGWGHSVGMSQYGAQGQANEDRTWQQILQHYYQGVSFGNLADPGPVWVGLAQSWIEAGFTVVGGHPVTIKRPGKADVSLTDGQTATVTFSGGQCLLATPSVSDQGPCDVDFSWDGGAESPTTKLSFKGRLYARGTMHVRPNSFDSGTVTGIHVAVQVPDMEKYLKGVWGEMPSSWHEQALRAQAVAARSYAAYRVLTRGHPSQNQSQWIKCYCHLYHAQWSPSHSAYRHRSGRP
ncbi:MAG: SpoIID/LytB domain-containing protein [Acidimicrobiia bacterium]